MTQKPEETIAWMEKLLAYDTELLPPAYQNPKDAIRQLLATMKVMGEALEFYADTANYLSEDAANEYKEPFAGLFGGDAAAVMSIMDAAGQDGGAQARQALTAYAPYKALVARLESTQINRSSEATDGLVEKAGGE